MTRRTFEENLAIGKWGEDWFIKYLTTDDWLVIPVRDIEVTGRRGPHAEGRDRPTLPDLQAIKHGRTVAIEVKTKVEASLFRITGQLEHGIDRHKWDGYYRYDREMPTFLAVVEQTPVPLPLIARITDLRPRDGAYADGTPMKFWPRDQMEIGWPAVMMRLNRYVTQSTNSQARARPPQDPGLW